MNDLPSFPLSNEIDHDILMHRDVHFGGNFTVMIDYYQNEGKGTQPSFEIERLEELRLYEEQNHCNLSELLLSHEEKESVQQAKNKYFALRDLYENSSSVLAQQIADLILSEDPEAEKEIQALCKTGVSSIPWLIDLLKEDDFFNPLFPGYGMAPGHAAKCLGLMKAAEAVAPLFESLSKADFFTEEAILEALSLIGSPARSFLLHVIQKRPISKDNHNAAIALLSFKDDPSVTDACFSLLQDPALLAMPTFFTYLLLICDSITNPQQREFFLKLYEHPDLLSSLKEELRQILLRWKLLKKDKSS